MAGKIDWEEEARALFTYPLPDHEAKGIAEALAYWYEKGYDMGMDAAEDMEMGIAPNPWDEEDTDE